MSQKKKNKSISSGIQVHGFYRLKMGDDNGNVIEDSGWIENTVTNDGLDNYIAGACGAAAGSKQFSHLVLATQTDAVNATQASLLGETRVRKAITPSVIATGTFQATASWSSNDNTSQITIGAIGLHNHLSTGSMGAGQTFTQSAWATNQNISATYQVRFS